MDSPDPPAPRHLRGGRYVLLSPLGQGSQGTTWDAVDRREGRAVAVKAFDVRGARSWKDVELAERETRVLSELHHPLLPRYFDHFEDEGVLYLVMEKVEGTPLSTLRKRGSRMSEQEVLGFLSDADTILRYLHGRSPPVVHRDLKPSNVIRRTDGSFAFVDFGAVRDRLRPEGGSTVVGTFGYMAPEQFQGRAGPASDVYAIGATALAMLTGREPEDLPHRGLTLDVRAALGTTVSPRLQEALVRMLEPDPDRRASAIGGLLPPRSAKGGRAREPGGPREGRDRTADWVDSVSRYARRLERREARRAEREAWRHARHRRGPRWGGLHAFVWLVLTVAQLAVSLALDVVVPLVLTLLSAVFGRGLVRAANAVREAGEHAGRALREARRAAEPRPYVVEEPRRVEVPEEPPPRVRVDPPVAHGPRADEDLVEEEELDDDEPRARDASRRRRR